MDGFDNIANNVTANQDEEVWMDLIYYKDRQHMKEVMSKMEKDKRIGESIKHSMALLPPGAKFIMGEFERQYRLEMLLTRRYTVMNECQI